MYEAATRRWHDLLCRRPFLTLFNQGLLLRKGYTKFTSLIWLQADFHLEDHPLRAALRSSIGQDGCDLVLSLMHPCPDCRASTQAALQSAFLSSSPAQPLADVQPVHLPPTAPPAAEPTTAVVHGIASARMRSRADSASSVSVSQALGSEARIKSDSPLNTLTALSVTRTAGVATVQLQLQPLSATSPALQQPQPDSAISSTPFQHVLQTMEAAGHAEYADIQELARVDGDHDADATPHQAVSMTPQQHPNTGSDSAHGEGPSGPNSSLAHSLDSSESFRKLQEEEVEHRHAAEHRWSGQRRHYTWA